MSDLNKVCLILDTNQSQTHTYLMTPLTAEEVYTKAEAFMRKNFPQVTRIQNTSACVGEPNVAGISVGLSEVGTDAGIAIWAVLLRAIETA